MTIFSSLPNSPDVLSFLAGLEGGKSPKSVPSEGADGFAELLDQLSAVLPADAEALGLLTGRQDAGLPGGKDLPVDLVQFAAGLVLGSHRRIASVIAVYGVNKSQI